MADLLDENHVEIPSRNGTGKRNGWLGIDRLHETVSNCGMKLHTCGGKLGIMKFFGRVATYFNYVWGYGTPSPLGQERKSCDVCFAPKQEDYVTRLSFKMLVELRLKFVSYACEVCLRVDFLVCNCRTGPRVVEQHF